MGSVRSLRAGWICALVFWACGSSGSAVAPGPLDASIDTAADGSPLADEGAAVDGALASDGAGAADTGADAAADASMEAAFDGSVAAADAYAPQAPHCTRDLDASTPVAVAFDAGAMPSVLALPQVMNGGGPVLEAATMVSVTFPGDTDADELDDFVASVGCSAYWSAVTADYGVGPAVAGPAARLTEQAPGSIDDAQIKTWLVEKIEGGDPRFPRPAPETVYIIWYPVETTVTRGSDVSCVAFGGYHDSDALTDGTPFSYVVMPRCTTGDAGVPADALTAPASHEILEACTDPEWSSRPAYELTDTNHPGPVFGIGSEIADMCELTGGLKLADFPWPVAKAWSNRSAWAADDPCAPAPGTDYVYAAPLVNDIVMVGDSGVPSAVVHVPVGGSDTVEVHVIGNASALEVQLSAMDALALSGQPPAIFFSFDNASSALGATVHMTLTKNAGDPTIGAEPFVVVATWIDQSNYLRTSYFWALTTD